VYLYYISMTKPNSMFDIVKWCENKKACEIHHSTLKSGGNDPSISRKMRFSQYVRSMPHRTTYTKTVKPKTEEIMPLYYYPSGQVKPK